MNFGEQSIKQTVVEMEEMKAHLLQEED